VMNQHRLVVDPKVIRGDYETVQTYSGETQANFMLFHQLSRVTREKGSLRHDDRLDALAIAVAYWTESLAQDAEKKTEERKEEKLQSELDRFMENALGRRPKPSGWCGLPR
jgi:hypothetical protein